MDTYIKLLQEHRVSHLVCATDQAYRTEDLCKSGAKNFFSCTFFAYNIKKPFKIHKVDILIIFTVREIKQYRMTPQTFLRTQFLGARFFREGWFHFYLYNQESLLSF